MSAVVKALVAQQYFGRALISTWMNTPWTRFFVKTGYKKSHLCKWTHKTPPNREWSKVFILALCEISRCGNAGLCACILSLSKPIYDFCMNLRDQFMFSFLVVQMHSISVANLCYDNLMNLYHAFQFLHQPRFLHRPRQIQPTPLCPTLLVCYCR